MHKKWNTSVDSIIQMNKKHQSARSLALQAISSLNIACAKSSSQSDVGALTHRSCIGASRILLNPTGIPRANIRSGTHVCLNPMILNVDKISGWFGNPSIRAVSKLCSSVMQLTLKVKYGGNVENLSPTLSLMSGSTSWFTIHRDGSMNIHSISDRYEPQQGDIVCSLYQISHANQALKAGLIECETIQRNCCPCSNR